jgi:hypothetical protein
MYIRSLENALDIRFIADIHALPALETAADVVKVLGKLLNWVISSQCRTGFSHFWHSPHLNYRRLILGNTALRCGQPELADCSNRIIKLTNVLQAGFIKYGYIVRRRNIYADRLQ